MAKTNHVLAVSMHPDALCAGALAARKACEVYGAGAQRMLLYTLKSWAALKQPLKGIIIAGDIKEPGEVRAHLEALAKAGGVFDCYTLTMYPRAADAFQEIDGVTLHQGDDFMGVYLSANPDAAAHPLARVSRGELPGKDSLLNYIRYKTSLFLMADYERHYVQEAIEAAARCGEDGFDLHRCAPNDASAADNFNKSYSPYLEGASGRMRQIKRRIRLAGAQPDMRVLLIGETGTGKEAAAFYVHEFSPRRAKPFVAVNCAGLSGEFLQSTLFGHKKGAFTGAVQDKPGLVDKAEGGTLFLDEITDMPLPVQAQLLRFLQLKVYTPLGDIVEKQADVRIVAAAQPRIRELMIKGGFRDDLFYRIAEVEIELPPLRDIPEDLERMISHLAYRTDERINPLITEPKIDYFRERMDVFKAHTWPGNVRELARLVKRRMLLEDDVAAELGSAMAAKTAAGAAAQESSPSEIRKLRDVAAEYAARVFESRGKMSQREVALKLGIAENTLKGILKRRNT